jgi:hypothetical protein
MSPGRSQCVRRPRGAGGLGRERTEIGQATHRVMLMLFHFVCMNKVKFLSSIGNFGSEILGRQFFKNKMLF